MRFNYLEPATIEEAVSLLGKYDGKAKVVAGGTDLLVQIRDKLALIMTRRKGLELGR
jgi:carbon-monoxide dehydrogenase medium subunit